MSVIKKMRRQRAVYWRRLTADRFGKFSYAPPVEIKCRWDDGGEENRDATMQLFNPVATVYVDREMLIGDMLKKGEMESDTPDDPRQTTGAHEIKKFMQTPNFRATETLFTAIL